MTQPSLPSAVLTISPTSDPEWRLWRGQSELPEWHRFRINSSLKAHSAPWGEREYTDLNQAMGGDWSFVNDKGTLYKRFVNAVYKACGKDPDSYTLSLLDTYTSNQNREAVFYRITDKLDWSYREYGDSSCFWSSGDTNRVVLTAAGCMALNFRRAIRRKADEYEMGAGIGRCWVIPCDGGVGLTNFYGLPSNQQIQVFKEHLGVEVKSETVGVTAQNDMGGYAYRNGDGLFFWLADQPKPTGNRRAHGPVCACYLERTGRSHQKTEHTHICANCPHGKVPRVVEADIIAVPEESLP